MNRRPISLAHFTVMDVAPGDLIPLAAEAGFDYVGIRIEPPMPTDSVIPVVGDKPLQARIRAQMDETGVRVRDIEAFWLRGDTDVAALRPAMETGVALGASHVLTVGNDPEHARLVDNLGRFTAQCAEFGLRPMLEFITYTAIRTLSEALAIREEAEALNAGILVDSLHLSRSGGTPADLAALDPGLMDYVHLCDAATASPAGTDTPTLRREARGERLYPMEGVLPVAELVRAAPDTAFMAIEAPCDARAALPAQQRAKLAAQAMRAVIEDALSHD